MVDRILFNTAVRVTAHCLLGCAIGESLGLFIGGSLNMEPLSIMILSASLAFVTGMLLAIIPIVKKNNVSYLSAMKIVFWGESISIIVMEIAMNGVDFYMGGMSVNSVFDIVFWISLIAALPAGYLAALPVTYWLVKKHLKKCH